MLALKHMSLCHSFFDLFITIFIRVLFFLFFGDRKIFLLNIIKRVIAVVDLWCAQINLTEAFLDLVDLSAELR